MQLIDSHAHLDFDAFHDDFGAVLDRAREAEVAKMISIGVNLETSAQVIVLAEHYDEIFATVGVHPEEINRINLETLHDDMLTLAKSSSRVVAIGETGLDFYAATGDDLEGNPRLALDASAKESQVRLFQIHIDVAQHLSLPLIIHIRNGEDEEAVNMAFEILKNSGHSKGVIHCFTLGPDWAKRFVDLGFSIGFTGIITYKNAEDIRESVRSLPLEKILIETDCPFLAPQKYRGKRNEPAYVVEVATKIAEIHEITLDKVAEQTTINVKTLFGI
jgi:TatD DNase family protein